MTPELQNEPKLDPLGLILRAGLFILIGWLSLNVFATLLFWLTASPLITGAFATFGAAAVANAITVRVYERGKLSALGLAWTHFPGSNSLREKCDHARPSAEGVPRW